MIRRDILGCGPERLCVVDGGKGGRQAVGGRWLSEGPLDSYGVRRVGRGLRLLERLLFGGCPSVRQQQKHVGGMAVRGAQCGNAWCNRNAVRKTKARMIRSVCAAQAPGCSDGGEERSAANVFGTTPTAWIRYLD